MVLIHHLLEVMIILIVVPAVVTDTAQDNHLCQLYAHLDLLSQAQLSHHVIGAVLELFATDRTGLLQ